MDPAQWPAALQVTMPLQCHLLCEQQALVGILDAHKPFRPSLLSSDTLEKVRRVNELIISSTNDSYIFWFIQYSHFS